MSQLPTKYPMPASWPAWFKDQQQRGNIPDASFSSIDANNAVFSDMYLDLEEVQKQVHVSEHTPFLTTVYADVLTIPDNFVCNLDGEGLHIIARRIETGPQTQILLDYRRSKSSTVVVFADEWSGAVQVKAISQEHLSEPVLFALDATNVRPGVQITWGVTGPVLIPHSRIQDMPAKVTDQFEQFLNNTFLNASLSFDRNPGLALSMMSLTKAWSAGAPELMDLNLRSASMVALLSTQINARKTGSVFVPYLTEVVYTDLAQAFVEEARQYEQDYMELSTQGKVTQRFIQLAQTMVTNAQFNSDYVEGLKQQALNNYNNAKNASEIALKNFEAQQHKVEEVRILFEEVGVPEFKRNQIVKFVLELLVNIVSIISTVGTIMSAKPAAAAANVDLDAAGDVEAAVDPSRWQKFKDAIGGFLNDKFGTWKKLVHLLKGIRQALDLSLAALEAAEANQHIIPGADEAVQHTKDLVQKMNALDTSAGEADLADTSVWDLFKNEVDASLNAVVDLGVEYAGDYRKELSALTIYGKSLSGAQLAVIRTSQEYTRILLQQTLARQQQAELTRYVSALQEGETQELALMQQFYQRYLDAKSFLFTALQNYRASYFYCALLPSGVQPEIIGNIDNLDTGLNSLTKIKLDAEAKFNHFDPPPAPIEKTFVIDDPAAIAQFVRDGKGTWNVGLDEPAFDRLGRVRLNVVRVWLEGATSPYTISIGISNSGSYQDRLGGDIFHFTSKPLSQLFQYKVGQRANTQITWTFDDNTVASVEKDGGVIDEMRYAYFQPTPFAEWTISLNQDNRLLDLTKLSKITIQFIGSAIGRAQA